MKIILLIALSFLIVDMNAQNIGIGTTTPQSKLSVGTSSQFQVDSIGNIKKINNVPLSFPVAQGSNGQVLTNNGNGNLNWSAINTLQKSGSILFLSSYDTSILSLGYIFIGKTQLSIQTTVGDTTSWQWGTDLSLTGAPTTRYLHSAVWTGAEMIIWGGYTSGTGGAYLNNGYRYNPLTNTWATITTNGAPSARNAHTAIWTGTEMIIWGGSTFTGYANDGGRYNPVTNTWNPVSISTANAPSPRFSHSAVWTGTEMIVWGGAGAANLNDGGAYNPTTNTWSPAFSSIGAPQGRNSHTAIWTGTEMIVWGGSTGSGVNTGGRYTRSTNTWGTPLSLIGVPTGRHSHSAIWTGNEMIIWGGFYSGCLSDGMKYYPTLNTWSSPLSSNNAPVARFNHTAIWTGSEMIIWGGMGVTNALNDGRRFGNYPTYSTTGNNSFLYLYMKN